MFVLDYALGYALQIWPDKVCSTPVAFDRYLHGMLVDPRRDRYGGSPWSAGAMRSLARPVGRLDAPAEAEGQILRCMEQRLEDRHAQLRVHDNPRAASVLLFFVRHGIPVRSRLCRIVINSDICCRARFPILMPHPYGIIMHSHTAIGPRVMVMQQVNLAGKDLGENVAPIVEDDVYTGAEAKVLGRVRIGGGAMIGANAVVTRDVPPCCTVVGANRIVGGSVIDVVRERVQGPDEPRTNGLRSA